MSRLIDSFKIDLNKNKFVKIIFAAIISIAIFLLFNLFLNFKQSALLGSLLFMIILWTNESLTLGIVSLFPLILFPFFGISTFQETVPNYFKQILLLFLGGMLLAISIEKTNLHKFFAVKMISFFPKTPRGMIYAVAIVSGLLSSILSNTTVALMLLPIALFLSKNPKLRGRLLIAVAYGASIGGILTPIGTPPNLILFGFMRDSGLEQISFFVWILAMLPLVTIMLLAVPYFISRGIKKERIQTHKSTKLDWKQKRLIFVLLALVAILIANSPLEPYYSGLGLNENFILLIFGLLMFLPIVGYLKLKDLDKIPVGVILIFGAGFSIAFGLFETGIIDVLSSYLASLDYLPILFVIAFTALFGIILTEIGTNTAIASVLIPIVYGFMQKTGIGGKYFLLVPAIAASMSFMLPIATPPNSIIMASHEVKVKDMIRIGFIANVLSFIFITLVAFLFWRILIG